MSALPVSGKNCPMSVICGVTTVIFAMVKPDQAGVSGKECLHDHNSQKDKAVQSHSRIQDHCLEPLPFFYDDFARLYAMARRFTMSVTMPAIAMAKTHRE